jgi:4'-phosphopantetheinyl transferase
MMLMLMPSILAVAVPDDIPSSYMNSLLMVVADERKNKISRYLRQADAYRSLLGELLTRFAVIRHTSLSNERISFTFNSYGKPFLQEDPEFRFNISHSGGWVVLICDRGSGQLGIDVEQIAPIDMKVAERFFSKGEYEGLMLKPEEKRLEHFYCLWTLKESYIKALGKGLAIPLDSFSLMQGEDGDWRSPQAKAFQFMNLRLDERHILSACTDTGVIPDHASVLTLEDLYQAFVHTL